LLIIVVVVVVVVVVLLLLLLLRSWLLFLELRLDLNASRLCAYSNRMSPDETTNAFFQHAIAQKVNFWFSVFLLLLSYFNDIFFSRLPLLLSDRLGCGFILPSLVTPATSAPQESATPPLDCASSKRFASPNQFRITDDIAIIYMH
jgi:hypothetical protein